MDQEITGDSEEEIFIRYYGILEDGRHLKEGVDEVA